MVCWTHSLLLHLLARCALWIAGKKPCVCTSLAAIQPNTVQQQYDYERNTAKPEDLLAQSNKHMH